MQIVQNLSVNGVKAVICAYSGGLEHGIRKQCSSVAEICNDLNTSL